MTEGNTKPESVSLTPQPSPCKGEGDPDRSEWVRVLSTQFRPYAGELKENLTQQRYRLERQVVHKCH